MKNFTVQKITSIIDKIYGKSHPRENTKPKTTMDLVTQDSYEKNKQSTIPMALEK